MSSRFAELAWQETAMGELSLRRRRDPVLDVDVYEVKLGDEFLMSSLFTVAEVELAHLGLADVTGENLDVLVGGLGLGYTAQAALSHSRVRSVTVIDALAPVIDWHTRELLPVSASLVSDTRTSLIHDDFFAMMRREPAQEPAQDQAQDQGHERVSEPEREIPNVFHAILVDIDHSPRHLLNGGHADFYTRDGLANMGRRLAPGGVFALWSDDAPDDEFAMVLAEVFSESEAHVVTFDNALTGGESTNTVYVAKGVR